ncbi:MAG TPA: hypothetical protein VK400_12290 [Pyrinomonadaceae bacterium]|nr:hypothetical protein [Pyrinomonadaceae bacterium]
MAKKKFDTNPLDPEFPEKLREAETNALPKNNYKTAEFPPPPVATVTEEETRRFNEASFNAFNSPYDGSQIPAQFQTAKIHAQSEDIKRKVEKVGLPENVLTALPYIPFYIGLISGLLILLFVPKSETKVRFHAAQGLAAHIGIFIVSAILGLVGNVAGFANFGNWIFQLVTMVMLVIFAVKAWQGKPVHIESVDDLTEWLEQKIKPVK